MEDKHINPKKIDIKFLEKFSEFRAFKTLGKDKEKKEKKATIPSAEVSPEEMLETAYQELHGMGSGLRLTVVE